MAKSLDENIREIDQKQQKNIKQKLSKIDKDQKLLVLEDLDNANEYFFYHLDAFYLDGHDYVCFASYEPDLGEHIEPELVIMRTMVSSKGERIFESIRDDEELDKAFEAFYRRIENSLNN